MMRTAAALAALLLACGAPPDPAPRWEAPELVLGVHPSVDDELMDGVQAALDTWATAAATPLVVLEREDRAPRYMDGRNTISLLPIEVEGYEEALGVAQVASRDGVIFEGDITMNAIYPWAVLTPGEDEIPVLCNSGEPDAISAYDWHSVVLHELGHFFGLSDVLDEEATMFHESRLCSIRKRTLEPSDVASALELYGPP